MTDQELNEAVARKLGWVQCCNPKTMESGNFGWSKGGSHFHEPYPDYCHDIRAAWEVCEYLVAHNLYPEVRHVKNEWNVRIFTDDYISALEDDGYGYEEETAARAICLAFLKLP